MSRYKEPTWTSRVLNVLRAQDTFMDYAALRRATGASPTQVSAACIHLRRKRAIDCVVEVDGTAWWFANRPEDDNRMYHHDERTPESRPRRTRRFAKKGAP